MLQYSTAGESHGKCLLTVIEGLPYGMPIDLERVNAELTRRQGGYGRGARMKMEHDQAEILSGVRHGKTLGSPLVLMIPNRVQNIEELGAITKPRPGHADLAGAMKFGVSDARDISERSSARETAARVAAGAVAAHFLSLFDMEVLGYVVEIGTLSSETRLTHPDDIRRLRDQSIFYTQDPTLDERIKVRVDDVRQKGDTLGGIFEVIAFHAPPGLGSHAGWRHKLDGRLAYALMSVQTVKAVEVGLGFVAAKRPGSQMHDEIVKTPDGPLGRKRNNAGGIEGGMSNGESIVVRAACKPISTLRKPLETVDLETQEPSAAQYERSDVCVVPAASVIGQAVVAFEIATAFLEKFGGDTYEETRARYDAYRESLKKFPHG